MNTQRPTKAEREYADIINLPHHVSANHRRMPMQARAAQFAPFAALTSYDAALEKTARSVEESYEKKKESGLENVME